jgi:excinuclease ABC subunit C
MTKKAQPKDETIKELRSRVAKAPTKPGIYKWLGKNEEVLYVGKAKNLKNRLKSYVQKPDKSLGPWKMALIGKIADVDWTVTETEIEALILETNLIKELKPKYNVMMKDDKNYVYVRITINDAYPSFSVVRLMEDDGARPNRHSSGQAKYFGPFLTAYKINRTLDMLHAVYDFKACKRSIDMLNKEHASRRRELCHAEEEDAKRPTSRSTQLAPPQHDKLKPCLDSQIGKCCGLCTGKISREEYGRRVEEIIRFFKGDRKGVITELQKKMEEAASAKKFEKAAMLRDTLAYIQSLEEQQIVSDTSRANTDAIGITLESGRSQVVVLRERNGKLIGERSYALAGEAENVSSVLEQFLPQYYTSVGQDIPEIILCPEEMEEKDVLEKWLTSQHGRIVKIKIPKRGKKSKLLTMAEANAHEKVTMQLAKWEAATQKVEEALKELKEVIGLDKIPKRIECYDISHLGGTETVGSMVVATNGKADTKQYRSFTIRTMRKGEIDDYKALKEVLTRRLRHLKDPIQEWKKQGVLFGTAKKIELHTIEETLIHNEQTFKEALNAREFIVARKANDIIGFGRMIKRRGDINIIQSLWVDDRYRGKKLGYVLLQKLIARAKKGKVYITIHPHLEGYYTQANFRHVHEPPVVIREEIENARVHDPHFPTEGRIVMVYIIADHKVDTSLSTHPNLLLIDGGKGQLSAAIEVMKKTELNIPVISLAKREEEVFAIGPDGHPSGAPLQCKKDSEGLFLLMRLRDEAHRFANRHREKRLKHRMLE